jgi:CYTH domain-containing protein
MLEIEKTFLVKNIPVNLSSYKSFKIKQGYLSSSHPALRIRQRGDKFELTKKIPLRENDWSSTEEINIPLTQSEFDKLWPLTEKYLEKTRYLISIENNLIAELDIFEGELTGLAFVEVEFPSETEMNSFKQPNWFGQDITQKDFAANVFLAGKTFFDIQPFL